MPIRWTDLRRTAVATLFGWSVLAWQCSRAFPFIADDTLISLRYSERLAAGQGLSWTDGEWVEGYSNLLYVLLCAALGAVGLDLILAARVIGIGAAAAAVLGVAAYGARSGWGPALAGAALLGAAPGLGIWAVGGLEQPLLGALLAGAWGVALVADERREGRLALGAGGLFALAAWTRPDAPLFAVLAGVWGLKRGPGFALRLGAPALAAVALQLGFRLLYYGDWVPNTAHAKLAMSWHRVETGLAYVWEGSWPMALLIGVAGVGAVRTESRTRWLLIPAVGAWLVYVGFIGGDIFPARRHLLPILPALALLGGQAFRGGSWPVWAGALGLAMGNALAMDSFDSAYARGRAERWEWSCGIIAAAVGQSFREADPLLATNAAGCWPYFSGLDSLDMLGLNDSHIATHPTPILGQKLIGHELGDGEYVLRRQPDLLLMGTWEGAEKPGYYGERQLAKLDGFRSSYRLVRFESQGQSALIWVRHSSERIGPIADAHGVVLGPWLFGKQGPGVVTVLPKQGRPYTRFAKGARSSASVELPAGTWRVEVEGRGPAVIQLTGGEVVDGQTVRFDRRARLGISLVARGGPLQLEGVRLIRQ